MHLFQITSTIYPFAHLLLYIHKIYPEINLPVYHDAFLPANHEDLPVDSATLSHDHRCTHFPTRSFHTLIRHSTLALHIHGSMCLLTHLFSPLFSFQLNMHTYLSTHLLVYIPTDPPKNKINNSSWCYFLLANHEGNFMKEVFLPRQQGRLYQGKWPQRPSYLACRCTHSSTNLLIWVISFQITAKIYLSAHLMFYI